MKLSDLKNKKIAILGLGIENYALVEFLIADARKNKRKIDITVCDAGSKKELCDRYEKLNESAASCGREFSLRWRLGKNYDKNLADFDIVFRVAGYPLFSNEIKKAAKSGTIISSPTRLFFDLCPNKIIGVTGTNGKGTTASLICEILKVGASGRSPFLGGNIGNPMFGFLGKLKKNDWVVLELSSFQLEDLDKSPRIAVITNFAKDHLAPANPVNPNYHKNLRDYWKAKLNILKHQKYGDKAVVNNKLKAQISKLKTASKSLKLKSKIIYFAKSDLPSKLVGEHNKENIAAAVEVAKLVGVKKAAIEKAVKSFKGLEHRLEFVGKTTPPFGKGGLGGFIKYYNDTFATTPEPTITALNSFDAPVILIAGGADKGSDFKKLAKIIKKKVKFVVLLNGKATPRLKKEILKVGFLGKNIKLVYNMKEAVKAANKNAVAGDIILLSPACASFGMFKDYKERGRIFKEEVNKQKSKKTSCVKAAEDKR